MTAKSFIVRTAHVILTVIYTFFMLPSMFSHGNHTIRWLSGDPDFPYPSRTRREHPHHTRHAHHRHPR